MKNLPEVNQRCCLEESGLWLENVDQGHLVLASGKPVLQEGDVLELCRAFPILEVIVQMGATTKVLL